MREEGVFEAEFGLGCSRRETEGVLDRREGVGGLSSLTGAPGSWHPWSRVTAFTASHAMRPCFPAA